MANTQDNSSNNTGNPTTIISYNQVVAGIDNIQTAPKNIFNFTDLSKAIDSISFPDKNSVNECFFQENFNRLLNLIRTKMVQANSSNNNYCRVIPADTAGYKDLVVTSVKSFLTNKGYAITEIENADGVSTGWKLSW